MFNILVVDDDSTCLTILTAFLQKWNYEVTAVKDPFHALFALRPKKYDLVVSDVHMPNMNGFQLLNQINREFKLPVILISSDSQAQLEGLKNGALYFMVKPIGVDEVKYIWQFSVWWKNKIHNNTPPREINTHLEENVVRKTALSCVGIINDTRTSKVVWSRHLHNRFVEALFILGFHNAKPKAILDLMNEPELTRNNVASHLQKYRILAARILDGDESLIDNRVWYDANYYSSVVSGNPHLMLVNQLRDERRTLQSAAPVEQLGAGQSSSSSSGAHQFSNTSTVNEQQLDVGQGSTQESWSDFAEVFAPSDLQHLGFGQNSVEESWLDYDKVFSPNDFLLDTNPILGGDEDVFWAEMMNLVEANNNDVREADAKGAENTGENKDDENYSGDNKDVGLADNKDDGNSEANDKDD